MTELTELLDIGTAAKLLGWSERHVRRACCQGQLKGAVKNGGGWSIPISAHPKLSHIQTPGELSDSGELLGIPVTKREEAIRRLGLIQQSEKFVEDFMQSGGNRTEGIKLFANNNHIPPATFYRWREDYRREGLLGLVDGRGGAFGTAEFTPEAAEAFKAMYLTPQQLSVKLCRQNICYMNKSEDRGWSIPSLRGIYRWIDANIPKPVQVLLRDGKAAYDAKCAPYIQTDPDSIEPGQWWTGDHHQLNIWVRHRNIWVRPWLTAWEDIRSRVLVGWHINAGPNQSTILSAMRPAIEKFGPPDFVKIDNGKDYDSQMWTGTTKCARRKAATKGYLDETMMAGLYGMMGIGISFAIPYHPQSKMIERLFDTIDQQFAKTFKTYCGKDTERKPEQLVEYLKTQKAIDEAYDLKSLSKAFAEYAQVYNNTLHSGVGMEERSPLEVIATRTSRRVIDKKILDMLLCVWSGELLVGKNGVRFKGLNYGQYEPLLLARFGKKVRVVYNPDDIRRVSVYEGGTMQFICSADQNQLIKYGEAVNEEHLREASRQKSAAVKAAKAYRDSSAIAGLNLTDLTIAAMNEAAKPQPEETQQTLRPVATVFDGQLKEFDRQLREGRFKKAVGAESMSLGLNELAVPKKTPAKLGLFNG